MKKSKYMFKLINFVQTKLCFLAVDNPSDLTEHDVVQQILSYLETDTVFFISDVI